MNHKIYRNRNTRINGFTLIEILIAIVVVTMALIPMATVISNSLTENLDIERKDRTAFLAQKKLEEVKIKMTGNYDAFPDDYPGTAVAFPSPDASFRYRVTISQIEAGEFRQVNVQVWYDGNGDNVANSGEETTTLYTKISRRGG